MDDKIQSHKDLIVWQKAMTLVVEIYKITDSYPKEELYGLTSQTRRAAVSIPANIAEGKRRNTAKDFIRFLHISAGSVSELETLVDIAKNLSFVDNKDLSDIYLVIEEISKMLNSLISKLKPKN